MKSYLVKTLSLLVIGICLSLTASPFAIAQVSTPQIVCDGDYCQKVGGALLKKLLSKGWQLKEGVKQASKNTVDRRVGLCGSTLLQRAAIPDNGCFAINGMALPYKSCSQALKTGVVRVAFGLSCKQHDICYGASGAVRSICDNQLKLNIIAACDSAMPSKSMFLARETCYQTAATFERELFKHGCDAYVGAQAAIGNVSISCD